MPLAEVSPRLPGSPRPAPRARRRLRTRIILSFFLLGLGLTLLLAFATNWVRGRVEEDMISDVMNRNIDEYARRYYVDPQRNPAVPLEQIRARKRRARAAEQPPNL